jgi:predicted DNA-binding ArsR family transcriptional regulator
MKKTVSQWKEEILNYMQSVGKTDVKDLSKALGMETFVIRSFIQDIQQNTTSSSKVRSYWRAAFFKLMDAGVIEFVKDGSRYYCVLHKPFRGEEQTGEPTRVYVEIDKQIDNALKDLCNLLVIKARQDVQQEIDNLKSELEKAKVANESSLTKKFFNFKMPTF